MTRFNHYPTDIHCNNIKQISKYIRKSNNHLKDIKIEATNDRGIPLNQLSDEKYILEDIKHMIYLRSVIIIEQQVTLYQNIQPLKRVNDKSRLKEISIPKDKTINWNTLSKHIPDDQWEIITDPTLIEN